MKFNPDAYASYPVLRPYANDYPSGEFTTGFKVTKHGDDGINLEISFNIAEPTVQEKVTSGMALCCAYVYCTATAFSQMLQAEPCTEHLSQTLALRNLYGRVEVHPSIIAINDISLRTDTANEEYRQDLVSVGRYKQLAAGTPWHFAVGAIGGLESAFKVLKDTKSNLEYGEFEFDSEPKERYITVKMNAETHERFQQVRIDRDLSRASVFLVALTSALERIWNAPDENPSEEEHPSGWAVAVREQLKKKDIEVASISTGLAAQKLLGTPLNHILREGNT